MNTSSRRDFLRRCAQVGSAYALASQVGSLSASAATEKQSPMRLGLCTYLWAQDWDLPTILSNCEKAGLLGVELRTEHRHGVEPTLNKRQREEVKRRFAQSPVNFIGMGTDERFDSPDPAKVAQSIKAAKAFLQLSHDCGGTGAKVKPNDFHEGVPHEKTIEQIGKSLNVLGAFAADLGQQVRLEIHGCGNDVPVTKQIMDVANHPSVAVCWNSDLEDLSGAGLEGNFNMVKKRFGATAHVKELDDPTYPFPRLIQLFVKADYRGWLLLECNSPTPKDPVTALIKKRQLFERLVAAAKK